MTQAQNGPRARVLVTGGGGFLGQVILRELLATPFDCRALDLNFPAERALGDGDEIRVEEIVADICDYPKPARTWMSSFTLPVSSIGDRRLPSSSPK